MKLLQQKPLFLAIAYLTMHSLVMGAETLVITPTTFDFGWSPDNSKISGEFKIKNLGTEMIPIQSVQPTCGCTASQFTPGGLASNEETTVLLTFNTRGYAGSNFDKSTKVKTESGTEYNVQLKGSVLDSQATFFPDNEGVAAFDVGSKEKKKIINLMNKGPKDLTLEIIQNPASWVSAKLSVKNVRAGASVPLEISLKESLQETKDTSITIEAKDGVGASRLTVAIRTGTPPPPVKRETTATPVATPNDGKPNPKAGK